MMDDQRNTDDIITLYQCSLVVQVMLLQGLEPKNYDNGTYSTLRAVSVSQRNRDDIIG